MEDDDGNQNSGPDVAPALIAVHPTQHSVAVSIGQGLRVFNLREGHPQTLVDESDTQSGLNTVHKDSIRAIRYGADGKLFVSAGDDKLVKIWATDSWRCVYTVLSEKRVSAVAVSNDGHYVCFADKFGVVYVVDVKESSEEQASLCKKGIPIFSHYCSIITSLEFSPDGRFIVSADRDFKIRVTVFPINPLEGAREIQSFCLGHTEFVSCLSFICTQDHTQMFLVSGGGDSTVRLWDYTSGHLLDTCAVGAEAEFIKSNRNEDNGLPAVTDLCSSPDGSLVAVAVQSLLGVVLMSCDLSARTLSVVKIISIDDEVFVPTSLRSASLVNTFSCWMVMGVSRLDGSDSPLARVRFLSGLNQSDSEPEFHVIDDEEIPGGKQMLDKLQGALSIEKEVFASAAEAVKKAMRNLLIKKNYSEERRENRKRGRNDKKNRQR